MDELRDAKQRVALAESVMKLGYIKATRNASVGQERFVARDDVITVIHEYAKRCREDASAEPAMPLPEWKEWNTERVVRWIIANYTDEDLVKAIVRLARPAEPAREQPVPAEGAQAAAEQAVEAYKKSLDIPELEDFCKGAIIEAQHQRQRWGDEHDATKDPEEWFWLVGYLAGKGLHSQRNGDMEKFKHHLITGAAVLANWHARALAAPPATAAPAEVLELAVAVAEKRARETVAAWMIQEGFATGHGDTLEDLLRELKWQVHDLRMKLLTAAPMERGPK